MPCARGTPRRDRASTAAPPAPRTRARGSSSRTIAARSRRRLKASERPDSGVRTEQVDRTEGGLHGRDEVLHLLLVAHVARDRLGARATLADAVRSRACGTGDDIGDDDRSAVGREPLAQRAPDPRPAPGDHGVLPSQLHGPDHNEQVRRTRRRASGASRVARQRTSAREPGILARSERANEQGRYSCRRCASTTWS